MPKVIFRYDFEKDAWAWAAFAKRKSKIYGLKNRLDFIPPELLKKIRGKNKKSAEKLVYDYLVNNSKKKIRKIVIEKEKDVLRDIWRELENKFFKRLEKITQKPIFASNFRCYFTTGFMCPYDEKENWFMVSMWHSIPADITTICHETLHLQFLYYYREYCQKFLSEKEIQDLKEALTFLLNTDFNDLILSYDMGYSAHKKLRIKLEKIWKEEKDFGNFLDKAIQIVKNKWDFSKK